MYLEFFRLIFEINFFLFPISAGWLSYRKIKGKPGGRALRMTISSGVMVLIAWTGVFLNESQEVKAEYLHKIEQHFGIESDSDAQ